MNGWILALIIVAGLIALVLWLRDAWQDFWLFADTREQLKRRALRQHGLGRAYDQAVDRIDQLSSARITVISLTGLGGLAFILWLIFS